MNLTTLEGSLLQFQRTLDGLYIDMLSLTDDFIGIGQAIGALGALVFISSKVWGHLARAEPVDVYPLLRPFAIGLCIMLFPQLCTTLRGVTLAISHGTDALRVDQVKTLLKLSKDQEEAKAEARKRGIGDFKQDSNMDAAIKALTPGGVQDMAVDYVADTAGKFIREGLKDLLQLASMAARLALHLMSTLLLALLSIAGPLVFGIAIIPGFEGGIIKWLGYFITLSLWVPVANLFAMGLGKVQIDMLNSSISSIAQGASTDAADTGLLLFLALSTIAYILVPMAADTLISTASSGASAAAAVVTAPATAGAAVAGGAMGAGLRGVAGGVAGTSAQPGSVVGGLGNRAGAAIRERIGRLRS